MVLPESCPPQHSSQNTSARVLVSQIPGLRLGSHGAER